MSSLPPVCAQARWSPVTFRRDTPQARSGNEVFNHVKPNQQLGIAGGFISLSCGNHGRSERRRNPNPRAAVASSCIPCSGADFPWTAGPLPWKSVRRPGSGRMRTLPVSIRHHAAESSDFHRPRPPAHRKPASLGLPAGKPRRAPFPTWDAGMRDQHQAIKNSGFLLGFASGSTP
jgi:hypothetical protein